MSETEKSDDKRKNSPNNEALSDSDESGGWVGPLPTEAVPIKKRKGKQLL